MRSRQEKHGILEDPGYVTRMSWLDCLSSMIAGRNAHVQDAIELRSLAMINSTPCQNVEVGGAMSLPGVEKRAAPC
jgi:hypothetical protein